MFRHLSEAKTQIAMLKDMLQQQKAMRQQTSEPVAVGSRLESSAAHPSQPVADQAAAATRLSKTSQWYGIVLYCTR